jgi:hypothetical protein
MCYQHKRQLLAHQFAFQLEMSGDWQAAAYVLLSSAPSNVEDGIMDTGDDAIACQDAARALQAVCLSRSVFLRKSLVSIDSLHASH